MDQIKVGAFLSYLSLGLSNIIGILYTPFMLRMLGQSEYGLYSLVFSIVTTLALLDCGFGPAIVRYTAKFKYVKSRKLPSILGMFLMIYFAIGVISLILCILLANNSNIIFSGSMSSRELHTAKIMIWIIGIYISISFPFSVFSSIITAYEKFIFLKTINIIRILITPLIMIPLLLSGYKAIAMAIVLVGVGIITWFVNLWFCIKKLQIRIIFTKFDIKLFKEVSSFSIFIFIKMIADRLYWSSGQFILGAISGTVAVAIFSIALLMKGYYEAFAKAIDGMFLPRCTTLSINNNNTEISNLFVKLGRIQSHVLGYILSIYIIFGNSFILLWAGPSYENSYILSLIIIIPYLIPLIQNLGSTILQGYNKLRFQTFLYLFLAILTATLSIYLTHLYNALGCAIALSISIVLGEIILMNFYYYKFIKINIKGFWEECLKILIPLMILTAIFKILYKHIDTANWFDFIINVTGVSFVYLLFTYFLLLNKYEKGIIDNIIKKLQKVLS